MTSVVEKNCTYLISTEKSTSFQQEDICKDLESKTNSVKVKALKNAIIGLLAGEPMPLVLMTVIRFCINCNDHQIKKLLMLYWELVPKYAPDGKLLPEMILVCNALRNDLMSPNEYIRGCMLRFLCKLKEAELLEPLIPSIKQALEHRHAYVRRNAALAVYSIHKTFGEQLLPDAPELMETFINNEADKSARRNAFLMLFNEAEHIAIDFLSEHTDDIQKYGDGFALLVLELTRKTCRRDPAQKSRFVRCLFQLIQSESAAVSYEAAWTLVSLSSAPTAVRACAQAYTTLLSTCSDNNVKLIVLDRLIELKKHHTKVVQEILMDIMRALSSPNIDICKKTLSLAIDLVGPRNVEEVVQVLKREVVRTQESDIEHAEEYKALLIQAIHRCATRFAEVADSVVLVLLDFLAGAGGIHVMQCVKSIVEQYPAFRGSVLRKIIQNLDEISNVRALRSALWVLGEYSNVEGEEDMLTDAYDAICTQLGETPFTVTAVNVEVEESVTTSVTKNVVLADGTYASVTSTETQGGPSGPEAVLPNLRKFVIDGDFLLGTVACVTLTKLTLLASARAPANRLVTHTLLACSGVGQLAESKNKGKHGVHADCIDRLSLCCRILLDPSVRESLSVAFLETCHAAFSALVSQQKQLKLSSSEQEKLRNASQADDLIQFRQLRSQGVQGGIEVDLMDADDISRATGTETAKKNGSSLPHVHQLTGYSDPVYAEATIEVHEFDIILDILVINRTPNTLTNLALELATMGDLKIVERPQSHTIGPLDERRLKANIKVSSTETGHIFGTIVFDNSSTAQKVYVNLSDIQLDIMDYIRPGECLNDNFRAMWAEFEWENKVSVSTNITDLQEYLQYIVENTNMTCITPLESPAQQEQEGVVSKTDSNSNFLAANLYARSVFGEDALVNVSIERKDDNGSEAGAIAGYIRIRSKTQGIALSLGDRITSIQRSAKVNAAQ